MGSGRAGLFTPSRFDGQIGDGNRPQACRMTDAGIGPSAWADRTVQQLAWGTRVVKPSSVPLLILISLFAKDAYRERISRCTLKGGATCEIACSSCVENLVQLRRNSFAARSSPSSCGRNPSCTCS